MRCSSEKEVGIEGFFALVFVFVFCLLSFVLSFVYVCLLSFVFCFVFGLLLSFVFGLCRCRCCCRCLRLRLRLPSSSLSLSLSCPVVVLNSMVVLSSGRLV